MEQRLRMLMIMVLLGLISLVPSRTGLAVPDGTTINVTTSLDQIANDGLCSLREAIQAANLDQAYGGCSAGSGLDTILLPAGDYPITLQGTSEDQGLTGDLDITASLNILGGGIDQTSIDGMLNDRIFHVIQQNIQVSIGDLTLKNGSVPNQDLLGGGAVLSWGHLTLTHVRVQGSSASRGGGLRNSLGKLTIDHGEILKNHSQFEGGGIYGDGEIILTDSLVLGNTSEYGAGISADANLVLTRVTIEANQASLSGGGVFTDYTTSLKQVAFLYNRAIFGGGFYNNNEAVLTSVTFGENQVENPDPSGSEHGGGIYNSGTLLLINNTLRDNIAGRGGGVYNSDLGQLSMANTILSDNAGGNCANYGEQFSLGFNIEDTFACQFDEAGDRPATDPLLAPLADDLGIIKTYALLAGSPAIDTASEKYCPFVDQRGVIRPVDGDRNGKTGCDIGAHENTPGGVLRFDPLEQIVGEDAGSLVLTVTRTGGSGGVGVDYGPGAGTAVNHADFYLTPGTLNWLSGDLAPKTLQVEILEDIYAEDDEYGLAILSRASGGAGILDPGYLFRFLIPANDPGGPPQPYGPIFLPVTLNQN